ncbi:MAG: tryptophan synthase subunit alpha, partial [Smithella sp.]
YISITGITGTAAPKIDTIKIEVEKIRKITGLPVAIGFGISKPQQASQIARFADGVVIGSAVVRLFDENKNNRDLVKIVSAYASEIKKALR